MTTTFSSALLKRTLGLLKKRLEIETYQQISDATGLGKRWLEQLRHGQIEDPGVKRVETLYNYVSKVPLVRKKTNV